MRALIARLYDPTKELSIPDRAKLADALEAQEKRIAELEGKISQYRGRIAELVADLDNHYGTPCEQIRHQQALEKAEAALTERTRQRDRSEDALVATQAVLRECMAHADAMEEAYFKEDELLAKIRFREWRAKHE